MNPMLQGMQPKQTSASNPLANIMRMMQGKNPEQVAMQLMQMNPEFKAFIEANQGRTPEQVAQEHGINLAQLMGQF